MSFARRAPTGWSRLRNLVKVLYIAGFGRSGSTLLASVLDQVPGFVSLGEVHYAWDRGFLRNDRCGCGQHFHECPFWGQAFHRAFGDSSKSIALTAANMRRELRVRDLLRMGRSEHLLRARMGDYAQRLGQLYEAVREQTQCRVIVDSSKTPSHGYVLEQVPKTEVYILHLVRDSRAVSFSWHRRKAYDDVDGQLIQRQGIVRSSGLWTSWNLIAELRWSKSTHYARVRYEDFVENPRLVIQKIVRFTGERRTDLPFISDGAVDLTPTHAVAGNPSRFQHGRVPLTMDSEWKRAMRFHEKALVTLTTWPMLVRYGYM